MSKNPENSDHGERREDTQAPTLLYGFRGRAYKLSARGRRLVQVGDVFWGLILFGSVMAARFEQISVQALFAVMAAVVPLRFVVLKTYLVMAKVPAVVMAKEPAVAMPMSERARLALDSMPPNLVKGAMRTFSITAGVSLIIISMMIVVIGKFSYKELLAVCGLIFIFAFAVSIDFLIHKIMAKKK